MFPPYAREGKWKHRIDMHPTLGAAEGLSSVEPDKRQPVIDRLGKYRVVRS